MTDLRKILAMKLFVESSQIRVGYARFLRTAFWLRLLQISVMGNCRFRDNVEKGATPATSLIINWITCNKRFLAVFSGMHFYQLPFSGFPRSGASVAAHRAAPRKILIEKRLRTILQENVGYLDF